MVMSDCQLSEVRAAVRGPLESVRQLASDLEALSVADITTHDARFEQWLQEIAHGLVRTAEVLSRIPAQVSQAEGAAFEAQAESLRRYFSHTETIAQRFTLVMNHFKDVEGPISLEQLTPLLVRNTELRREDAMEQARRKLERFKDCSLLEARRAGGSWSYSITDHAREFIDRGVFSSMGVSPRKR